MPVTKEPLFIYGLRQPDTAKVQALHELLSQESDEAEHVELLSGHAETLIAGLEGAADRTLLITASDLQRFWKPAIERLVNNAVVPHGGPDGVLAEAFERARARFNVAGRPPRIGPLAVQAVDQMVVTE